MRKAAIRNGDPTTTGGFVIAFSSTIHDDGRQVALSGDEATCGNCKGTYKIYGTGEGMTEKTRCVVVEGDVVLCPCKKNRVVVGSNPGIFLEISSGNANARSANQPRAQLQALGTSSPASNDLSGFDELIVLRDEDDHPITNQRFRIKAADGGTHEGTTNDAGETVRVRTDSPMQLEIELLV
jgi:hypothetical protein